MENNVKEYYLRDFDYLPEDIKCNHYGNIRILENGIKEGKFKTFPDYESALRASIEVRKILGLETEWLEEKLMSMHLKEAKKMLSDLTEAYIKKKVNNKSVTNYPKSMVEAFDGLMNEIESYETKS